MKEELPADAGISDLTPAVARAVAPAYMMKIKYSLVMYGRLLPMGAPLSASTTFMHQAACCAAAEDSPADDEKDNYAAVIHISSVGGAASHDEET